MSAESMNKHEQLHIKDNETLQVEQATNVMRFCQVDSHTNIASKSVENIESHVEVPLKCVQICTDSHGDEESFQSSEQVSQSLKKSIKIDIDSTAIDTTEIKSDFTNVTSESGPIPYLSIDLKRVDEFYSTDNCSDSSKSEHKRDDKKIDDLSNKDDELPADNNSNIQTTICKDTSVSSRSDEATELSADYLIQMMKNNNDREMAIYEGAFLLSDETVNSQDHSDKVNRQSSISVQEALITDVGNKDDNTETIDKIEIVVTNNNDSKENLYGKEKCMAIDETVVEEVNEYIAEKNDNEQDLLPIKELLVTDESNSPYDVKETENEPGGDNFDELESLEANNKFSDGKIPLDKIESSDLMKAFSQCKLKDISTTAEPSHVIDRIQSMNWLKPAKFGGMETNRRKVARRCSIEKEEYNEDVKEELSEDTKSNSKSAKKRSSQSKNRKAKAVDSSKQDSTEDQSKKSSSDARLAYSSKNETSKSANIRAIEKSKDTKGSSTQTLGSSRTSIGRGRNDRRKISSLGNSQPKGQSDTSDQRNKFHRALLDTPIMEENSSGRDESLSTAQGSSYKVEMVEDFTENTAVTDSTKSKKLKVCETETDSRLDDGTEFLHNQLPAQIAEKYDESSCQRNEDKIDAKKDQLPSVIIDDQESRNKSGTNLPIRPIYGRSVDERNSGKVPFSAKGFGQKTNEIIEQNKQPFQSQNLNSEDNLNTCSEQSIKNHQNYSRHSENKIHQSFTKQENYSNKNTSFNNTSYDVPRWNHNNYPDKQNMKSNELPMQKGFTSNRHRNIEDEKKQNEEPVGKNQMFTDKCHGSKEYSDKFHDRNSGGRYNERIQENRNFNHQYYNKKQDYRNYGEWTAKNQDSKSYSDIVFDRNQGSQGDRYFGNQNNRGFGEGSSDRNQDKAYGERYSDKVRDSKNSGDRYSDKNQPSKTPSDRFYDRSNDGNQVVVKKQETSNRNPVIFDKNENCSDKSQIANKSLDSSSKNQILSDKTDYQTKNQEFSNRPQLYSDKFQDNKSSNNKSLNSTKETLGKLQIYPKNTVTSENYGRKNQDISSNNGHTITLGRHLCKLHQQERDQFEKNFWAAPVSSGQEDWNKALQDESNIKSQKHYDNTQQAKVQRGLNELQQSCCVPSVTHQQELCSSIDQNIEQQGKVAHPTDLANAQPNQSVDWDSHENSSKQDAVHTTELKNASPYSNVNMPVNPALANEYNLQYNQTILNSSTQFSSVSKATSSEQRPNIVMTFEGNQNVQRALGLDPSAVNQSQPPQVNNNDLSRANPNSPASPQQLYTNANAVQFFQSLTPPTHANSQTTLAYSQSTMNVNAPPFEVPKPFNQELNNQPIYTMQPMASKNQTGALSLGKDCVIDAVRLNEISNYSEEYLKLHQEVSDLSKQLALKQAQLLAFQVKLFKTAMAVDKTMLNQPTTPPIQPIGNNHLVQEQNQTLPSTYVQVKHPNYPPVFGDVSLNVQSTRTNLYEMSTNVATVQNYAVEKVPSNSVLEPRMNAQPVYLAQGNVYQQQAANYQMYTDKAANSATYINMIPQTPEPIRQVRTSVIQFPKQ